MNMDLKTVVFCTLSNSEKKNEETFKELVGLFSRGRTDIVYNKTSINPCQYSVATLKRSGLRDIVIVKD